MSNIKPVIQQDFKDCGVCSMEYIIMYYNGYIPTEKLREDTFTDTNGTTAFHIVNAFQKWGFDAIGVYEHDLYSFDLYYPLIAHLKQKNNLEHFVVITNIKKDIVYLMDPGSGYKKMPIEEFNKYFTGHIILAKPREKIIKFKEGLTINKLFFKILFKEKFLVLKIIIISILFSFFSILSSYYLKIGSNIISEDYNLIKFLIIIFLGVILGKIFSIFIRDYFENHLSNLVDLDIYPDFFNHLFHLPLNSIKSRTSGEIMLRVTELANIKSLFTEIFIATFLDLTMVIISVIVLYFINLRLFVILIIFLLFYIILGIISSKIIYHKLLKNITLETDYKSTLLENVEMYESIKNLGVSDKILQKIERSLTKYLHNTYYFNKYFNITNLFKNILIEMCFFLINTYGFINVYKGNLSLVDLFTFDIMISYCVDPIKNIIDMLPKFNYIKATFNKLKEFINIEEESNKKENLNLDGDIIFQDVKFSYNNYDYILNNINIKITKGDKLLLEGVSGVGKSTICKLLYKEYIPNSGEIYIGKYNLKDICIEDIRDNILYISQNENLFTGTIKENILIYRDISEKEFHNICEICLIEDIVSKKSMRYNSLIEPTSKNLSGGEKQRIILARGLLKKCNIIILDEALSEVDIDKEKQIIKNIKEYFKEKTIIYISHKKQSKLFNNHILIGGVNE